MVNKETQTLEQLKAQYEQAQKVYEDAKKEFVRKEAEEAERKKAKLAEDKAKREEEVKEAEKHYLTLLKAFIDDYGAYRNTRQDVWYRHSLPSLRDLIDWLM